MNLAVWVVAVYGMVSLVGGVIGYVKAKSTASLVAGTVSGAILVACANGMQRGSALAAGGSLLVAVLLVGRFLGTWQRNRRVMPDLIMVVLGLATLIAGGAWFLTR